MQLPRATRLVVRIAGKRMYLWRAVDHEGEILDMLVQRRRDTQAALRLMRKLLKKQGFAPKLLVTDKLGSYGSAFRRLASPVLMSGESERITAPKTPIKLWSGPTCRNPHGCFPRRLSTDGKAV